LNAKRQSTNTPLLQKITPPHLNCGNLAGVGGARGSEKTKILNLPLWISRDLKSKTTFKNKKSRDIGETV